MKTIFLNPDTWDLTLTEEGNIAIAQDPYAKSQDVASAVKLFQGELYYQADKGLPYFDDILGKNQQSLALYKHRLERAALTVQGVVSASVKVVISQNRIISGSIGFTDEQNKKLEVQLS